jgi:membrane protein YqaA with SNARE-associated domain
MHSAALLGVSSLWLLRFFRRLGAPGLFLFSALDSSFLVLPFGNDVLLIALTSADRHGWSWIGYVIASALGSVVGVLVVDLLVRKTGEKGLERFVSPQRVEQIKQKIEKRAGATVFAATLLPPPFPFTPVIMAASACQYPRMKLLTSVFVGRLCRYTIEAVLALYLGRRLIRYVNSEVFGYFVYGLIGIAVIASVFSILKWVSKKRSDQVGTMDQRV